MIRHTNISKTALRKQIKNHEICFGGNARLKIYGKLSCKSGKKMKKQNRVFFHSEEGARNQGFRPCGHCLKKKYKEWIYLTNSQ
ncbi:metal-binding protein [Pedobacter yonginense]|uniref:Metal-binding protein n=1 Tax=Pedobacter yonginense TaxID=651869 RepID=A0A317EI43_9SPHI|nr:Ada metal-binding domain-containing protein [Pedobacter yonginense]PWS26481.1 metal-binding protein [Pedobacter yonginense]